MVKAVALVSGGIDSAVAAGLALEQGLGLVFLHFDTRPLGNTKGKEKTAKLARHLLSGSRKSIKMYTVPYGKVLFAIAKNCERKYSCVLCRRTMLRIAERIAEREKAPALLTGESLGQVASQTLANLNAEHSAAKIPVIRPLLGLDKLEIERIARKLGTLETSILPSACCSLPEKPATSAKAAILEEQEKSLQIEKLAKQALESAEIEEIKA
ncbi:MAG: 7-cyano-7-deazaguanine synthase [Candidatus Diapherotrites archaeon]|uniref:7-cyano-7-deazaguanine synthase n=1 Tax=Candidatus Iainarchaeum sp. TaxID=3101447 RepID=A0A938YPF8_9ARCH|nr:7-cyano-7-deazaguanine synthase [Candidatus Diapherotrites archaeon]